MMHPSLKRDVAVWEGEGGALPGRSGIAVLRLTGSAPQVEWAEGIRRRVYDQFDRLAASLRLAAAKDVHGTREDTEAMIAILEDKRAEVMSRQEAGYFIHVWPEIGDRIAKMISCDPRYNAIRRNRDARRREATDATFLGDE